MSMSQSPTTKQSSASSPNVNNKCPLCNKFFDCLKKNTELYGRIPLVLTCYHVVCGECIHGAAEKGVIQCPDCDDVSSIPPNSSDKLDTIFTPHYSMIGTIFYNKNQSLRFPLTLVPTSVLMKDKKKFNTDALNALADIQDQHFLGNFKMSSKKSDSNSTSSIVQLDNDDLGHSIEFGVCAAHNGSLKNLYCTDCETPLCCYCFLENHNSHNHQSLYKLTPEEQEELDKAKDKAQKILKHLYSTQKKVMQMGTSTTETASIEREMTAFFTSLHARLHGIEHKLKDRLNYLRTDYDAIQTLNLELQSSINRIAGLLNAYALITKHRVNVKQLLEEMKKVEEVPCRLVKKRTEENIIKFIVKDGLDNVDNLFEVQKSDPTEYNLVPFENDGEDIPDLDEAEVGSSVASVNLESDAESNKISSVSSAASSTSVYSSHDKSAPSKSVNSTIHLPSCGGNNIKVLLTHVNDMNSFFLQLKSNQVMLEKLNRQLQKAHVGVYVEEPTLGHIYKVVEKTGRDIRWRRGKLIDIISSDNKSTYDVKYIDYGHRSVVTKDCLRTLNAVMVKKRAFAFECKLYRPDGHCWDKNDHIRLLKIIVKQDLVARFRQKLSNDVYEIDLLISNSNGDLISIADHLIGHKATENEIPRPILFTKNHRFYKNSKVFIKGERIEVIVAHVENPFQIYVRIARNDEHLKRMQKEMNVFFERQEYSACVPVKNTDVIVKYPLENKSTWHRATVLLVDTQRTSARVFLVDEGLTAQIPWTDIRMLTESFVKLECQAILVQLAHVDFNLGETTWNSETVNFLKKELMDAIFLKMVIMGVNPLEVALFKCLPTTDICINALLVERGYASSCGNISETIHWPVETRSELIEDSDMAWQMILKAEQIIISNEDVQLKNVVKQLVEIVHVENPHRISIKFFSNSEQYHKMHRELQAHYTSKRHWKDKWRTGDNCVVFYDEAYRRGVIIPNPESKRKYLVYLYDLMQEAQYPSNQIYVYEKYFNTYKNFITECSLAQIKPAGDTDKWNSLSTEILQRLFSAYRTVYVSEIKEQSTEDKMAVKMWYSNNVPGNALEPSSTNFISIDQLLVEAGAAFYSRKRRKNSEESEKESSSSTIELMSEPSFKENVDWNDLYESEKNALKVKNWTPALPLTERNFRGIVTCVDENAVFYVRDQQKDEDYIEMEKLQKDYFDSLDVPLQKTEWKSGEMCTILFENKWYRGTVREVQPKDVKVHMIDFGSDHVLSPWVLFQQVMYPEIPTFVNRVRLNNVMPKDGKWSPTDINTAIDMLASNVDIVIVGDLDAAIPLADIYSNDVKINDLLVQRCPNLVEILDKEVDEISDLASSDSIQMPYNFKHNFDVAHKKIPMTIISVINYNTLILSSVDDDKLFVASPTFESIQQGAAEQSNLIDIKLNDGCICLSSEDGMWHRGMVYNIDDLNSGYVLVYLVDSGYIEMVEMDNLKEIKEEWREFPAYNHICKIAITLANEGMENAVFGRMNKLCGKKREVEMLSDNPLVVHIYDDNGLYYQHFIDNGVLVVENLDS